MAKGTQIRLMVITASPNDAERIASHLRNAGHGVQAEWVSDVEQLEAQLPKTDLVLCASDNLPKAKLKDVAGVCARAPNFVPVVAMNDAVDIARTTQSMRAGARDLVSLQQMEHLQTVVLREFDHLVLKRQLREISGRLEQAETRHESLLQESTEALAYIQDGILIRVNPAYAKMFGFSDMKSVEGLPLMDLIAIGDRPELKQHLRQVVKGRPDKSPQTFRGLNMDGSEFPVSMRFTPTQIDDEDCIEVMAVPEHPEPGSTEAAPADFAGGTGRQALYNALDEALKTADKQRGLPALLFVRVDNMERLEQRLGFELADQAFNELAAFLLQSTDTSDHTYRFSSSEFVVLTNKSDEKQLETAASAIQKAAGKQVFGDKSQPISLTVSVGALPLVWHTDTQQILSEARQQVINLQSRKGSGIYVETQQEAAGSEKQQEKVWLTRIRTALDKNRFRLAYKAIVNLEGESSHYYDALLRMLGDKDEEIQPLEFVPIAERNGLMLQIDQWVVLQALLSMSARQKTDQEFGLFVRVSENSIANTDKFVPWLLKQIKGYPVRTDGLLLTFEQSTLLDNQALAERLFGDLKKLKICTAISHFGASPQSLQLLEKLPVDFVRLDAAVIKSLANPKSGERVSETLRQARQKGVRIVAKQVTDAQTMAMLWTLGVHFIEGEYVEEPGAIQQTA